MSESTEVAAAPAGICPECGLPVHDPIHLAGRGNIHDPDRTPQNVARDLELSLAAAAQRAEDFAAEMAALEAGDSVVVDTDSDAVVLDTKPISRMNKTELLAVAAVEDIEVDPEATVAVIAKIIRDSREFKAQLAGLE